MAFPIDIRTSEDEPLQFNLDAGDILFVLGANGTGKSALMQRLAANNHPNSWWISAHRQTWFPSNAMTMSPHQKQQVQASIQNIDRQTTSRWKDDQGAQRPSIALYDLVDSENILARDIAAAARNGDEIRLKELVVQSAPIQIINELLRRSNIPIEISIDENSNVTASKSGSAPYSVAELSDGERNALLISASVLTVKSDTLILIDEPERHLHRSIISPLLTLLFEQRRDCAFVVSTHDVLLCLDNEDAKTLLLRNCAYEGQNVSSWDADLVPVAAEIDDEIKKDILGSRRHIIFIEGNEHSIDKPLYSLLFNDISVVAKSNCRDVEHAVSGIRGADSLHWVHAWGIVDNDRRFDEEIRTLKEKGVYALSVFSVESIYYHPEIQRRLAARQASVTGDDAETMIRQATNAAIDAVRPHAERLSCRTAEKAVRKLFFAHLPNKNDISAEAASINVEIDVAATVAEEQARLRGMLDAGDLESVIAYYPVRETPALDQISRTLGFQGRKQYEKAVLKLLEDDADTLIFVRALFGSLGDDLDAA